MISVTKGKLQTFWAEMVFSKTNFFWIYLSSSIYLCKGIQTEYPRIVIYYFRCYFTCLFYMKNTFKFKWWNFFTTFSVTKSTWNSIWNALSPSISYWNTYFFQLFFTFIYRLCCTLSHIQAIYLMKTEIFIFSWVCIGVMKICTFTWKCSYVKWACLNCLGTQRISLFSYREYETFPLRQKIEY